MKNATSFVPVDALRHQDPRLVELRMSGFRCVATGCGIEFDGDHPIVLVKGEDGRPRMVCDDSSCKLQSSKQGYKPVLGATSVDLAKLLNFPATTLDVDDLQPRERRELRRRPHQTKAPLPKAKVKHDSHVRLAIR